MLAAGATEDGLLSGKRRGIAHRIGDDFGQRRIVIRMRWINRPWQGNWYCIPGRLQLQSKSCAQPSSLSPLKARQIGLTKYPSLRLQDGTGEGSVKYFLPRQDDKAVCDQIGHTNDSTTGAAMQITRRAHAGQRACRPRRAASHSCNDEGRARMNPSHPATCAAPMTSASVATGRAMRMSFSTVSVKTDTS